jgi:HD-like signal output (HDOD) protein
MPQRQLAATASAPDGPSDAQVLIAARSLGIVASAQATLWRELSDPNVEVRRIEQVLREDPVVAARVLKVANSAFYHHCGRIGTIEKALLILGFDGVRGITAAVGLARIAGRSAQGANLAAHSAAVASIARDAAAAAGLPCACEAFLAGLLHDLGLLVEWRLALQPPAAQQPPMAIGPTQHARFGALVLAAWQLPAEAVRAAAAHHEPPQDDAAIDPVTACVRAAHAVCAEHGMGLHDDGPLQQPSEAQQLDLAAIGIDPDRWRDFVPRAVARAQHLRSGMLA